MNLFGPFHSHLQDGLISRTNKRLDSLSHTAGETAQVAGDLRQRVELLALANQALFEILQDRLGLTEEEVLARMAEIDARDGAKDGKITPRVTDCPRCRRKVSTNRQKCMFCGELVLAGSPFERLRSSEAGLVQSGVFIPKILLTPLSFARARPVVLGIVRTSSHETFPTASGDRKSVV